MAETNEQLIAGVVKSLENAGMIGSAEDLRLTAAVLFNIIARLKTERDEARCECEEMSQTHQPNPQSGAVTLSEWVALYVKKRKELIAALEEANSKIEQLRKQLAKQANAMVCLQETADLLKEGK